MEDVGAQDGAGALWIADRGGHRIRRASPAGVMSTVAGSGGATFADGVGTSASFYFPRGIALDAAGFAIVADEGNNRIRRVSPDGVAATLAGNGAYSYVDGFGSSASFRAPAAVAISPSTGTVFVADAQNFRVRSVSRAGLVATLAGSGIVGYADGAGVNARFYTPLGIAVNAGGSMSRGPLGVLEALPPPPAPQASRVLLSSQASCGGPPRP